MKLARIFAQIALATAELAAALGFKGLRQFPVGAPIILIGAAGLVAISAVMWVFEAAAGGDAVYRKRFANLWNESLETIKDIFDGKAKESTKFNVKAAALSVSGALCALALAITPAGWIATGLALVAEITFMTAAYFWYKNASAEYEERYTPQLQDYQAAEAEKRGINLDDSKADEEMLAKEFSAKPTLAVLHAETDRFYNKSAATLAGLAIATAFIPLVGPAIAAGLAIMSGLAWLRGYHASKAYRAEMAESAPVKITAATKTPISPVASSEPNGSPVAQQEKPKAQATIKPVLMSRQPAKAETYDAAIEDKHATIANKLARHRFNKSPALCGIF